MSPLTRRTLYPLAVISLVLSDAAFAQTQTISEPDVPEKAGKEIHAFRISGPPPRIDGRLDEEVWQHAPPIEEFVQADPDNMAPATERTIVRLAYDDEALYVGVYSYMRDPTRIASGLGRRDNFPPSDEIQIWLDPRHDHLTGYLFATNPSGVKVDYSITGDNNLAAEYDGIWDVRTQRMPDGWTAEFRLPFSQMRFNQAEGPVTWGLQISRADSRSGERVMWVGHPRGAQGVVSRFGHLVFEEGVSSGRRIEISPFVLGRSAHLPARDGEQQMDVGLDVRYGLGSGATLSMTVNPDFGQVEQDPAVLNLGVFETQFAEKRPFFLEDSRVFLLPFGQFPAFYSPRIGRRPGRIPLQTGDSLVAQPERTTILGAAKLTGKNGGWTYGVLSALTDEESAFVRPAGATAGEPLARRRIEPRTSYNVARVQRDILGSTSTIGLIGTAVARDRDFDAFTGGGDAILRWDRNRYTISTHWIGTRAPVDGRMRSGVGGVLNFFYTGRTLGVQTHYDHFSRYFRNTDIGFVSYRVNKSNAYALVSLTRADPWRALRRATLRASTTHTWNGDGLRLGNYNSMQGDVEFLNYWSLSGSANYFGRVFSDLETRGGPPVVIPAVSYFDLTLTSDSRRSWGFSAGAGLATDDEGGWSHSVLTTLRMQPAAWLQGSLSARFNDIRTMAQWIANRDVTGDGSVDHIFGELRLNLIDLTARGTVAFTRDLTLEGYLQPFVSVGDYTRIKRLARPSSFDFEPAALPENPDFSTKSMRSNVVLRWEYSAGSTLYLVWQMSGTDRGNPGDFEWARDLGNAFAGAPTNVFMLKTTYWLGL